MMSMMTILAFSLGGLFGFGEKATPFTLVGEKEVATVVLAGKATLSSRLAAQELTNHVELVTGCLLPIATAGGGLAKEAGPKVFIGTLRDYPTDVPDAARKYLKNARQGEAGWVGSLDGNLHVVGRRDVAELYALYNFLEAKLGIIWFKAPIPEDPGTYIPKAATIELEPFAIAREPWFEHRELRMCCANWSWPAIGQATATRNGMQTPCCKNIADLLKKPNATIEKRLLSFFQPRLYKGSYFLGGGHGMLDAIFDYEHTDTFKRHPEYFALRNGKRVAGHHFCMSNPEVQRLTAEDIVSRFRRNEGEGYYLFGQADVNRGWCECEGCRAMDAAEESSDNRDDIANVSTRFHKFCEIIREKVRKELPGAEMRIWAYAAYRELPHGVKLDPRCKVEFCDHGRCYGHAIDDPDCEWNKKMLALMDSWRAQAPRLYTYEYLTCSDMRYICPERVQAHDLKAYRDRGILGWTSEAEFTGSHWAFPHFEGLDIQFQSCWQWIWMTSKMLWDPSLDGMALIDRVEEKYYGKAYPAMRKYQALRREIWDSSDVCMGYPWGDARRPTLLNRPGAKTELLGYLDEADKLAADDEEVIRFRVRQDRKWLNEFWIKANDELAQKMLDAYHLKPAAKAPVIDGERDAAWDGALTFSNFLAPYVAQKDAKTTIPEKYATTVSAMYDDENLYFFATCKEPEMGKIVARASTLDGPVWDGEDALEFFIVPPSNDAHYFQVALNANGTVFDAANPGVRTAWNSDAVVKTKKGADFWTVEVKIPVKNMQKLVRGEQWRLLVTRDCVGRTEKKKFGTNYSIGGSEFHNTGTYLPIDIGAALLPNGKFNELDAAGVPVGWGRLPAGARIVTDERGNAVELKSCTIAQRLEAGELAARDAVRNVSIAFRAKGRLDVLVTRYDAKDAVLGVQTIGTVADADETFEKFEYAIPANESIGIGFKAGADAALLREVTVILRK